MTAWAKERLAKLLVGLRHSNAGANVLVTELTSAAGEAHIWIMRSKKRCGLVAWRVSSLFALTTPAMSFGMPMCPTSCIRLQHQQRCYTSWLAQGWLRL